MKLELNLEVQEKFRVPDMYTVSSQGPIQVKLENPVREASLSLSTKDASDFKFGDGYKVIVSDEYVNSSEFYVDQLSLRADNKVIVSVKGNTHGFHIDGLSFALTVEEASHLDVGTEVSVLIEKK